MAYTPSKFDLERFAKLVEHNRIAQIALATSADDDEDEIDRLSDVAFAAQETLLLKPAPDAAALAAKLEILSGDTQWPQEVLNQLTADAMRLAEIDRAPTFVPEVWLHYFQRVGGRAYRRDGKVWLSAPAETCGASNRLGELTPWQRAAVVDLLEQTLEG